MHTVLLAIIYITTDNFVISGPILKSKGLHAIFKKKGKKRAKKKGKIGQKCTKFKNILKKARLMCATITCMKQLEYALNILIYEKSNKNILIYEISCKPLIDLKPLGINSIKLEVMMQLGI